MKKWFSVLIITFVLLSFLGPRQAAQANPFLELPPARQKMDPQLSEQMNGLQAGEMISVIVTLRQQADLSRIRERNRGRRLQGIVRALQAASNATQGRVRNLLDVRQARGLVKTFEPLWIVNGFSVTATSEVINELAAHSDVNSISPDDVQIVPAYAPPEANISVVNAPALWGLGLVGQGVVVANMDSGVDVTHPDLAGRWRGGTNSWFDPYNQHPSTPTDLSGHGTWTMGIMVGGDADGTTIGVAPGAQWVAVKIFNDQGQSTATAIHLGFQWILDPDHNPATDDAPQVVNNSWSFANPGCYLDFEPDLQALRSAGILPVFAAGNAGPSSGSSFSPANNPSAFSVGAITNTSQILASSSRGPSTCGGSTSVFPKIVAPGANILTTDLYGSYYTNSGTSFAAPHVAGALALLLSAYPDLSAADQEIGLLNSAVDLGASGPDDIYGYGRLDVLAAYNGLAASPTATPPPTATPTDTVVPTDLPPTTTATATSVPPTATPTATATATATSVPPTATATATRTQIPPTATATATLTAPTLRPTTSPSGPIYFSTYGNSNPSGVSGSADDADIYFYNGSVFSRSIDANGTGSLGLASIANVDGFDRVDATHFYLSFNGSVTVPGLGSIQDEDVVYYNAGTWSLFFDGSVNGVGSTDLDAISISNGTLYFSTDTTLVPPGAGGSGDDADIYRWNGGSSFTRVLDASALGWSTANVDGLVFNDANHVYLSYSDDTTITGLGSVQDEDVVFFNNGVWTVYFNGTALGLTSSNLDVDAFDLP